MGKNIIEMRFLAFSVKMVVSNAMTVSTVMYNGVISFEDGNFVRF